MRFPFPHIMARIRSTVFASTPEVPQAIVDTLRA
jgi:hypothetical protein